VYAAKPAQIVAMLEAAAALLPVRLQSNIDLLDHVLRLAAAALCAKHLVDPHTRLPVPCI
jgi:hypothetical protein